MGDLRVPCSTRPSEEQIARTTLVSQRFAIAGWKMGALALQIQGAAIRCAEQVERTNEIIRRRLMPALYPLARWLRQTELERRRVEQRAARMRKRRRQRAGRGYR